MNETDSFQGPWNGGIVAGYDCFEADSGETAEFRGAEADNFSGKFKRKK